MTRDFKQSDSAAPSSQYGISWVLGGITVGLLAGAVAYALLSKPELIDLGLLSGKSGQQNTQQQTASSSNLNTGQGTSATLADKPEEDERPGFSYHAVLPQLELDIPIPAPRETAPANTQQLPRVEQAEVAQQDQATQQDQAVNNQGRYMFQLGAYRNRDQAVQMQRRARQNGMNTRIEPAKINGQSWFRVRLGPTDNLQIVNRWKQRLSSMGINPMMIRL